MIRGVDVSVYEGNVDWPAAATEGYRFAILKCGEGDIAHPDNKFVQDRDEAKHAGLIVGSYHFAWPLPGKDPRAQAKLHFELSGGLGSNPGEIPPMLDFEWPTPDKWLEQKCSPTQLREWALTWLDEATTLWGCFPMLYTYPDFWARVGGGSVNDFARYALCVADYRHVTSWPADTDKPISLLPWGGDWKFWQTSGGAFCKIPLIGGGSVPVDTDVFNGNMDDLIAFTSRSSV